MPSINFQVKALVALPVFDINNPTKESNYRIVGEVKGMPLHWHDDQTGILPSAVRAYYNQEVSPEQLKLIIAYIQHHIHAPCFLEENPFRANAGADSELGVFDPEIKELRELSMKLVTIEDVRSYISKAIKIALDPL